MPLPTFRNKVACTPFEPEQAKAVDSRRLQAIGSKNQLVDLCVIYGTELVSDFYVTPEDVVFVRASSANAQWAKDIFTWQGVKESAEFILVPISEIEGIDRGALKDCCDHMCDACKAEAVK